MFQSKSYASLTRYMANVPIIALPHALEAPEPPFTFLQPNS